MGSESPAPPRPPSSSWMEVKGGHGKGKNGGFQETREKWYDPRVKKGVGLPYQPQPCYFSSVSICWSVQWTDACTHRGH